MSDSERLNYLRNLEHSRTRLLNMQASLPVYLEAVQRDIDTHRAALQQSKPKPNPSRE